MTDTRDEIGSARLPGLRGTRTWRLFLAFFGGIGGALLIVDWLAVHRAQILSASGSELRTSARQPLAVFAWPIAHICAVATLAYWPLVIVGLQRLRGLFQKTQPGAGRHQAFNVGVLLFVVLAYGVAVWISLRVSS